MISVCLPVHDEAETLPRLYERLHAVLSPYGAYEILFIDDGSRDDSFAVMQALHARDPNVKILRLSRNFGHQIAITAGCEAARGDAVILMDADLQDPPEVIPRLIEKWHEGYDVVYAVREAREGESWFKLWTAKLFYRLLHRMTGVAIPLDTGDFRLLSRRALDALNRMPEANRFVRGLTSWIGFRQTGIPYRREPRFAGKTKFPFHKMLRFALDGLTAFSYLPLQLATNLGFLVSGLSVIGILYFLYLKLISGKIVPGLAATAILILFLGGVQLICLGIIGEYLGRIFDEVKRRPLYFVEERIGFNDPTPNPETRTNPNAAAEATRKA